MLYIYIASFIITIILLLLSVLFKLAGKLRLSLPLLYFLLIATVFNKQAAAHEPIALGILFVLVAFSIISWLISLKNFIQERQYRKAMEEDIAWQIDRAKKNGIPLDSVHFDSNGNMRYNDTNDIVE